MSEMVERVAVGLVEFLQKKDPETEPWDRANEDMRDAMREMARHVLQTMREPTAGMVEAADPHDLIVVDFERSWRTMIDEALK